MFIDFATRLARALFVELRPRPSASLAAPFRVAGSHAADLGLAAILTAAGAALRLRGAEGDLWLDEIWTLRLLERADSIGDVFLGIHHDNNHFLNSAWLWLVGAEAPVLVMRLAAVVCGTAAIPAAAAMGRRFCAAAGLCAAFLFSFGYFFVHYGSEARGYAGMMLAILLAYSALEAIFDDSSAVRHYVVFALAICFGAFAHLTMVEATGALCLTALARSYRRGPPGGRPGVILVLAALATAPAVACFLFGALSPDFQVGAMVPFSLEALGEGLAGMIRSVLGLGAGWSDAAVVIIAAAVALALIAIAPAERRWFPAIAIFGLPILHAILGLPSQQYPRFHTTAAVALALLVGDGFAALWRRRGAWRGVAVVALGSIAVGDAVELTNFFRYGRGHYAEAVRIMGEGSPASYAVDFAKGETNAVIRYYSARHGAPAAPIAEQDWCETPPVWLVVVDLPRGAPDLKARRTAGAEPCRKSFSRGRTFLAWGLSGFTWTLYRRDDD